MQTSRRRQLANAIRALAMDAVQKANSGHPGMPMGMADIAQVLWADHLRHNPGNPQWSDRDRFVVSNGHGSMLLYSLLHLTGYPLTVDEPEGVPSARLADRRPSRARAASGHRDHHRSARPGPRQCRRHGAGGEVARRRRFNRPGFDVVDHRTWVFLGDGCLMEGSFARGLLAGRHAQARQAGRVLGRQRHFDRRRSARLVHRRHAEALRGVRLARRPRCRRPRSEGGRVRDRRSQGAYGSPHADLLQDHHRLRRAEQAGHRSDARRCARRGRSRCGPPPARIGRTSRS